MYLHHTSGNTDLFTCVDRIYTPGSKHPTKIVSSCGSIHLVTDSVKVVPYAKKGLIPPNPGITSRYVLSIKYKDSESRKTWLWMADKQRWKRVYKDESMNTNFLFVPEEMILQPGGGWNILRKIDIDSIEESS